MPARCVRRVQADYTLGSLDELATSNILANSRKRGKNAGWGEPGPIQPTFFRPRNSYTLATALLTFTGLLLSSVLSAGTCSQCSAAEDTRSSNNWSSAGSYTQR